MTTERKSNFAKVEDVYRALRAEYMSTITENAKRVWSEAQLESMADAYVIGALKAKLALAMEDVQRLKEQNKH